MLSTSFLCYGLLKMQRIFGKYHHPYQSQNVVLLGIIQNMQFKCRDRAQKKYKPTINESFVSFKSKQTFDRLLLKYWIQKFVAVTLQSYTHTSYKTL